MFISLPQSLCLWGLDALTRHWLVYQIGKKECWLGKVQMPSTTKCSSRDHIVRMHMLVMSSMQRFAWMTRWSRRPKWSDWHYLSPSAKLSMSKPLASGILIVASIRQIFFQSTSIICSLWPIVSLYLCFTSKYYIALSSCSWWRNRHRQWQEPWTHQTNVPLLIVIVFPVYGFILLNSFIFVVCLFVSFQLQSFNC